MFGLPLRLRRSNAKMFAEHVWKKEKDMNYQCTTSSSRAKRRYAVRGQYRIVMQCANAYTLSFLHVQLLAHALKRYVGLPLCLDSTPKSLRNTSGKRKKDITTSVQLVLPAPSGDMRCGASTVVMQCANAYPFFFACTTACSCSKKICWLTTLSRFNAKKFAEHVWKKGKDMNYQCSTSSSHAT